VAVGAIARQDDELLLIRRGHGPAAGEWSIPGGRVEHGEPLAAAVLRELAEETGLEAICGPLVGWVERISAEYHYIILDFEVTIMDRREPVAGDDAAEARWVPVSDVAELNLVDGLAEFLHDHGIIPTIT
jgi:8-oxo-dGTP diphosphatase